MDFAAVCLSINNLKYQLIVEEYTLMNQPEKYVMAIHFKISNFFCDFSSINNQISI